MRALLAAGLLVLATDAAAGSCAARLNGQDLIIVPEAMEGGAAAGLGERLLMWPSRAWDRAWGERVACDGATVTAFLARTMRLDQTAGYCLAEGGDGWLLVPGEAGFRGRCARTACQRVNAAAGAAAEAARTIASLAAGRRIGDAGDGVAAVAHGTGAMLLTGQAGAVAAQLGQAAGSVGAAVAAAPVAAGAAAVTVMAAGGAVYLCS